MRPLRWIRRGITIATLGATGGALVLTARHLLETPQPLESALSGEGRVDRKHGGDIYYNVSGPSDARPVVLLHDFYPGASNYEYRSIFPRFAERFRTYAPDWLGWGMSEHPPVTYTGEFYANLLQGFLRDVVGRPANVIAHGRAANVAVRAASDAPDLFESVVLVSPYTLAGMAPEPTFGQTLARTAQRTSLGIVPYALFSTRPVLRAIQRLRGAGGLDAGVADDDLNHLYASAHQVGGQHALLALLTGELDLPIQNALALLEPPALLVASELDPQHTPQDMEDLAILNPHADLEIVSDASEAVFVDQPEAFAETVGAWIESSRPRFRVTEEDVLLAPTPDVTVMEGDGGVEALIDENVSALAPTEEAELAEALGAAADAIREGPVEVDVLELVPEDGTADMAPEAAGALEAAAPEVNEPTEADVAAANSAAPGMAAERARTETVPAEAADAGPAPENIPADIVAPAADEEDASERTQPALRAISSRSGARTTPRPPTTQAATEPAANEPEEAREAESLASEAAADAVSEAPDNETAVEADIAGTQRQAAGTQIASKEAPEAPAMPSTPGNTDGSAPTSGTRLVPVTSTEATPRATPTADSPSTPATRSQRAAPQTQPRPRSDTRRSPSGGKGGRSGGRAQGGGSGQSGSQGGNRKRAQRGK